jgi:hypothetical protein
LLGKRCGDNSDGEKVAQYSAEHVDLSFLACATNLLLDAFVASGRRSLTLPASSKSSERQATTVAVFLYCTADR